MIANAGVCTPARAAAVDRPARVASIWPTLLMLELRLLLRRPGLLWLPLAFFVAVSGVFPLALDPDTAWLRRLAPATVWMLALLSVLLSHAALFEDGWQDGTLSLWRSGPHPLEALVLLRVAVFWLAACAPLVLLGPLMALSYGLSGAPLVHLALALLVGTPGLALLTALAAALTLGAPRAGALAALLMMPLAVPMLVFGAGCADPLPDAPWQAHLALLGACSLLGLITCPWLIAEALRSALDTAP